MKLVLNKNFNEHNYEVRLIEKLISLKQTKSQNHAFDLVKK